MLCSSLPLTAKLHKTELTSRPRPVSLPSFVLIPLDKSTLPFLVTSILPIPSLNAAILSLFVIDNCLIGEAHILVMKGFDLNVAIRLFN